MQDSSTDCSPCRLEWRPSRWHAAGVVLIGSLATFALLASRWGSVLPEALQVPVGVLAVALGVRTGSVIGRRAPRVLELRPGGEACIRPVTSARPDAAGRDRAGEAEGPAVLHEQWPVVTVRFARCGTTLVFWPDTLCDSGRRALRRWARTATPASPLPQFWMG